MEEVRLCVQYLLVSKSISQAQKFEFLVEQKHALGRTALILSGGGLFALFSFEQEVFPKIIAGSSAGSIVAALIAACNEQEIKDKITVPGAINYDAFMKTRDPTYLLSFWSKVKRLFKDGVILDINKVENFVRDNIGDLTFQEAYDKTGRILNITATGSNQHSQSNNLMNYITAPYVVIWSAVACSCSIPFVYGSSSLKCKNERGEIVEYISNTRFVDGSIGGDLPMLKLAELFNVTNFIVSQTNPFVLPFVDAEIRNPGRFSRWFSVQLDLWKNLIIDEIKHRIKQVRSFNLIPHHLLLLANLFDQVYTGHITLFPKPSLKDYLLILDVPSSDSQIQYFKQKGYTQSFEKVFQVKMQTFYERIIDKAYQALCQIENQKSPPNLKINKQGVLEFKNSNVLGSLSNSQYLFDDNMSDDFDKLQDIRNQKNSMNQQEAQNQQNNQLKTGFSQLFLQQLNNQDSQESQSILFDSDYENNSTYNQKNLFASGQKDVLNFNDNGSLSNDQELNILNKNLNLPLDEQYNQKNIIQEQHKIMQKQQHQQGNERYNKQHKKGRQAQQLQARNQSFTIPRSDSKELQRQAFNNKKSRRQNYQNKRMLYHKKQLNKKISAQPNKQHGGKKYSYQFNNSDISD